MDLNRKIYKTKLEGEEISLEFSKLAGKATAAVLGRYGQTAVLAAVVMSPKESNLDYFPLTVDFEEKFYAAGKIIGSRYVRREGRPSDESILSGRIVDRTIRPLFDKRLHRDVQVSITVLSYEEKNDPDVIALLAVSAALSISEIPWTGPVAATKIFEKDRYLSFWSGPLNKINMIEFEGKELGEDELKKIYAKAQEQINALVEFQKPIIKELGRPKMIFPEDAAETISLKKEIEKFISDKIEAAFLGNKIDELKGELINNYTNQATPSNPGPTPASLEKLLEEAIEESFRHNVLKNEKRPDGRKLDQVRELHAETKLFERTHGSALFIRGETQILALTTLGPPGAEQLVETMETTSKKRFMLHYNFPSFSVGEAGRSRGPGRREIGHGALAAKAISQILPDKEQFPYTIRVVAETLSSNGSTSMASTCATCLSLMDAGVPLPKHVGGISVGLVTADDSLKEFKLLTDIQGPEDHYGEMDFKVAGTLDGVTAIQMDVKNFGISLEIFEQALVRAKKAREEIIGVMRQALPASRQELSPFAPMIMSLNIPKEKIGELIGPGGKTINGIIANCDNQVSIDIEEDGRVFVSGVNHEMAQKAFDIVKGMMRQFEIGEIVEGKVIKILEFGAIVDLGAGKDGMIHVSELKEGFVKKVEDVVKIGSFVKAKVIRVEDGKIGLSIKQLNSD
ncbi:MAG: polyribonucleotide nucleotidyltransferase [bacterium]|nr:polyribonucleotide nucleotidyltransferase [bacterium]